MNSHTRPRDSTGTSGAKSASIVSADAWAPYFDFSALAAEGGAGERERLHAGLHGHRRDERVAAHAQMRSEAERSGRYVDLAAAGVDEQERRARADGDGRLLLRQQDANHRRSSSDIEAQWFTPPDRIVVHDGHPRAARFRLILRRGRGVVKGLDGLGWSRYGTP